MSFDRTKGLSPAMQGKYWDETICKESRGHMYHALNASGSSRRSPSLPQGNPKDFYANTWRVLDKRYDQAAGLASPLVHMARRFAGEGPSEAAAGNLRPPTGLVADLRDQFLQLGQAQH
eukprot:CAMPEP_0206478734 /NCGR_PEP_ID=MMETSP0324_2-20121206/36248_1 /ASSEMBLY_ACC=CAM_ASM_000836 /TAXON_ID=2866 /ORGANISM="Crypthecodinium cohnii, Strain Seligo" /LENGTH=118 /DNA_ID=CAMNT_0053955133 /DNA_START=30 /DNA_END=387 /DNA_ORIENTATION=+